MKIFWVIPLVIAILAHEAQAKLRVMIIDTGIGINKELDPWFAVQGDDKHGHGTHIAGLIALGENLQDPVCQDVQFYNCKYYDLNDSDKMTVTRTVNCFKAALLVKADIVNYSSAGNVPVLQEYKILKKLSQRGTKIIVSTGNGGQDLRINPIFPASYKISGIIPVESGLSSSNKMKHSIKGDGNNKLSLFPNNRRVRMSGTSQAAALYTHKLIMDYCREIK